MATAAEYDWASEAATVRRCYVARARSTNGERVKGQGKGVRQRKKGTGWEHWCEREQSRPAHEHH